VCCRRAADIACDRGLDRRKQEPFAKPGEKAEAPQLSLELS
jgi:hypothetical protein